MRTPMRRLVRTAAWSEETWRRLFGYLERLRVTELVVQWSVYADIAFYPSERHTPVPQPPPR